MPLIHLTRADTGEPLELDCCDPRFEPAQIIVLGESALAVHDLETDAVIALRETWAELDAIMAVAHPENAAGVTS